MSVHGDESPRDRNMIDAARRQIEQMRSNSAGEEFIASPTAGSEAVSKLSAEGMLNSFVGYEIIREIHRGGQGVVYQALQRGTKRKVAIKVMREGPFAGPRDRARFDREVEVLGKLNHPNIVSVHDTGEAAGCFYFVMDYISGQPLDAFLSLKPRTVRETLALFAKVCDAIYAANLRGVIHRDIKPSNIRVDSSSEPHILDFGLAKVATGGVLETSHVELMTITGQFVGSVPWASPEQAEGAPDKIDLRTDVYSLGVVLFQMLTGKFPYEITGNMRQVIDNILQTEPRKPSTLRRDIDDEVETIILKCLAKDRDRRYQTSGELARDIRRYLNHEPIEAKRDSVVYLLRNYLRRYRWPTSIAAAFVLVVFVGFVTSLAFWRRAELDRRTAEAVGDFVRKMIESPDPYQAIGPDVTVREILDETARTIDAELAGEPQVEAAVRSTLGNTYRSLGLYDVSEQHLQRALSLREQFADDDESSLASARMDLGVLRNFQGKNDEAEPLLRSALAARRRILGDNHRDVATNLSKLGSLLQDTKQYDEAEQAYREAIRVGRSLPGKDNESMVASDLNNLGLLLTVRRRLVEAEPLFAEALALQRKLLDPNHPYIATTINNMGMVAYHKGDFPVAEANFREALGIDLKRMGPDHPDIATGLNNLAVALSRGMGEPKRAEPLAREALQIRKSKLEPQHELIGQSLINLARILHELGDLDEALQLLQERLALYRGQLGEQSEEVAVANGAIGRVLTDLGRWDEAEPYLQRNLELTKSLWQEGHNEIAAAMSDYGRLLRMKGRITESLAILQEALSIRRANFPGAHPDVAVSLCALGEAEFAGGNAAAAEAALVECLSIRRAKLSAMHPLTASAMTTLAEVLSKQNRQREAEPLLNEALTIRRYSLRPGDARIAAVETALGVCQTALNK